MKKIFNTEEMRNKYIMKQIGFLNGKYELLESRIIDFSRSLKTLKPILIAPIDSSRNRKVPWINVSFMPFSGESYGETQKQELMIFNGIEQEDSHWLSNLPLTREMQIIAQELDLQSNPIYFYKPEEYLSYEFSPGIHINDKLYENIKK